MKRSIAAAPMVAHFCHFYPGMYWSRGHTPWPTRDGAIPMRLFFILYSEIDSVAARHELATMLGTGGAIANTMGGDDEHAAASRLRGLIDRAFPRGNG